MGTYRLHTRMPPTVAPIARASCGASGPRGSFANPGMPGKAVRTSVERLAARDRDAVPLREAVRLDVVAGLFELLEGELLGLALDLLHREHVDALAHREVDDPVDPGTDGVDVPRGKPHGIKPTARPPTRRGASVRGARATLRQAAPRKASTRRRVRSGSPSVLERQHPGVAPLDAGRDPIRRALHAIRDRVERALPGRRRHSASAAIRTRRAASVAGSLAEEGDAAPAEEREVVERMPRTGLIPVDHPGEAVSVARSSCTRRCRCGRSAAPARATRRVWRQMRGPGS